MYSFRTLFVAAGLVTFGLALPASSAQIQACALTVSTVITNDFATPSGDFGGCWSGIGVITPLLPGVDLGSQGVATTSLEAFIGATGFLFQNFLPGYNVTEGSVITNSLTVNKGDYLDVNFSSTGSPGVGFLVLEFNNVYTFYKLFDNSSIVVASTDTFSNTLAAGTYEIALGVVFTPQLASLNAQAGTPDLTINSVNVLASVPEPSSALLLLAGMGGLAFWRRRATR